LIFIKSFNFIQGDERFSPGASGSPETVSEMQSYTVFLQLECLFWRACGLTDRQKNANDGARFYHTMMEAARMANDGVAPTRREDYASAWQQYLRRSGLMLGQVTPPFFNGILSVSPDCDVAKNFIEHNSLQSFTENALLMSLVSFLFLRKNVKIILSLDLDASKVAF
jgi:hypothetical protein